MPSPTEPTEPLKIGAWTKWGRVGARGTVGGERYYWMVRRRPASIAMMPAVVVELSPSARDAQRAEGAR